MRDQSAPSLWPAVFGRPGARRPAQVAAVCLGAVVLLAACAESQEPTASPTVAADPCPDGAAVKLGTPDRPGPQALFSTAGGEVWVTARRFEHGGIFDSEVGGTAVYIGTEAEPLTYDLQSGQVGNVVVVQTRVVEGTWSAVELPEGRYRLWLSSGGDVSVRSCQPDGVAGPQPVNEG